MHILEETDEDLKKAVKERFNRHGPSFHNKIAELKKINDDLEMRKLIRDNNFIPPSVQKLLRRGNHDRFETATIDSARAIVPNIRYDKIVARNNPHYNKSFKELPATKYSISDLAKWGQHALE